MTHTCAVDLEVSDGSLRVNGGEPDKDLVVGQNWSWSGRLLTENCLRFMVSHVNLHHVGAVARTDLLWNWRPSSWVEQ